MTTTLRTRVAALGRPAGRPTPEFAVLVATVTVLLVLGLVMSFSASFVRSTAETGDPFGIFRRQLLWCLLGLGPMVLAARTDYRVWRRWSSLLMIATLLLAAVVLVPAIGVEVNGARRWLVLGPITVQPSELLKLSLPLYLAHVVARRWPRIRAGDIHALLMPAIPLAVVTAMLVFAAPDLETAGLLLAIVGLVLYTAGLPLRLILVGALGTAAFGVAAITAVGFRTARISAWLDPFADAGNMGYQSVQGFLALGSGGWLGTGLGQSRGKWLFLPNADTDFIFAIIGEELGLAGSLLVLCLYLALAVGGVRTARAAPDVFGRLLATAITGWLLVQAAMNIGSVVGILPVTGVTLPLVSVGGSSLVVTMAAVGLLLSVSRAARPLVAPGAGSDAAEEDET